MSGIPTIPTSTSTTSTLQSSLDTKSNCYFTTEQIKNSASYRCGMSSVIELLQRQKASYMIQQMGEILQLSQSCINTAIIYMHRFYIFHSFTQIHREDIAQVCILLATKVEEQSRRIAHIIQAANKCIGIKNSTFDVTSYNERYQQIILYESVLLKTVGFLFENEQPNYTIVRVCNFTKACKYFSRAAYALATNSLALTTMCLKYRATVVGCVCIYLASAWTHWKIPESTEGKPWFNYIDATITIDLLEKLSQEYIQIFNESPSNIKSKSKLFDIKAKARSVRDQMHRDKRQPQDWREYSKTLISEAYFKDKDTSLHEDEMNSSSQQNLQHCSVSSSMKNSQRNNKIGAQQQSTNGSDNKQQLSRNKMHSLSNQTNIDLAQLPPSSASLDRFSNSNQISLSIIEKKSLYTGHDINKNLQRSNLDNNVHTLKQAQLSHHHHLYNSRCSNNLNTNDQSNAISVHMKQQQQQQQQQQQNKSTFDTNRTNQQYNTQQSADYGGGYAASLINHKQLLTATATTMQQPSINTTLMSGSMFSPDFPTSQTANYINVNRNAASQNSNPKIYETKESHNHNIYPHGDSTLPSTSKSCLLSYQQSQQMQTLINQQTTIGLTEQNIGTANTSAVIDNTKQKANTCIGSVSTSTELQLNNSNGIQTGNKTNMNFSNILLKQGVCAEKSLIKPVKSTKISTPSLAAAVEAAVAEIIRLPHVSIELMPQAINISASTIANNKRKKEDEDEHKEKDKHEYKKPKTDKDQHTNFNDADDEGQQPSNIVALNPTAVVNSHSDGADDATDDQHKKQSYNAEKK